MPANGQPPAWTAAYVGAPFLDRGRHPDDGGVDCYGLARWVLNDRAGFDLPMFAMDGCHADKSTQAWVIASRRSEWPWTEVAAGDELPLDVAEIAQVYKDRRGRFQTAGLHMGVVVGGGWMLHTRAETGARLERYGKMPVERFWRWTAPAKDRDCA